MLYCLLGGRAGLVSFLRAGDSTGAASAQKAKMAAAATRVSFILCVG